MEVVDIGLGDLDAISMNLENTVGGHSDFGGGLEFLMNEKKISTNNHTSVGLDDLDKMENEFKSFDMGGGGGGDGGGGGSSSGGINKTLGGFKDGVMNLFGMGSNESSAEKKADEYVDLNDAKLGQASSQSMTGHAKTWDNFSKINDIPAQFHNGTGLNGLNERQMKRKKREMLNKLSLWYKKGLTQTNLDQDASYEEVEDEYENVLNEKKKQESIKLQGWWFMTFVNSVEYMNASFNPFDLNLDGWSDTVSEDLENYEAIFEELYEKYKGGKMAPELQLLLRLGFSATMANFANKALSTATPGVNDAIRHSPQLMKQFTQGIAGAMAENSPAMSFLNNMVNGGGGASADQVNTSYGPPPRSVDPRTLQPAERQPRPADMNPSRPDISMVRGAMFREEGVNMNGFSSVNGAAASAAAPAQPQRREMRGPNTDVDAFLSNLKTKTVNIHDEVRVEDVEGDSLISRASMKDIEGGNIPKRTNRKPKNASGKTISLDI